MRKLFCVVWPLALILFALLASAGCCARNCGPVCCMPPAYYAAPCPAPTCPQRRYSEEQWQYLDKEGAPRQMGDAAFREHLGLKQPAETP